MECSDIEDSEFSESEGSEPGEEKLKFVMITVIVTLETRKMSPPKVSQRII